ncbi:MAG: delta-aminolevulinic acid dehydratase [Cyclobacteriaceae bacterium]|nr:MAG: delta-aminolevulinic acid dehydratase [Cyclobacteriaceae bacterium]
MVAETDLKVDDLIFPLFLKEGKGIREKIEFMPGVFRLSEDQLVKEVEQCLELGINTFAVFPCIADNLKDATASEGINPEGLYPRTIEAVKSRLPEAVLLTDVAMDPYSSDGHDGLVVNGEIRNDETLEILAKMALVQAQAGTDIIGPSDMMDGRVGVIREHLDDHGFQHVSIMSYTAKYASVFYGPFRDALDSEPKHGDKKTYQMDPRNRREAVVEASLDVEEGADFLMVKPALAYLDVINQLSTNFMLPIAAYNVSGEYAMIKAADQKGWLDGPSAMVETLTAIKRAGADIILTYFAREYAELIRS